MSPLIWHLRLDRSVLEEANEPVDAPSHCNGHSCVRAANRGNVLECGGGALADCIDFRAQEADKLLGDLHAMLGGFERNLRERRGCERLPLRCACLQLPRQHRDGPCLRERPAIFRLKRQVA